MGYLGVAFHYSLEDKYLFSDYTYSSVNSNGKTFTATLSLYDLDEGFLTIFLMKNFAQDFRKKLGAFAQALIEFSILVGGFGKSWRRIHHNIFYGSYLSAKDKPMIGSYWRFNDSSSRYYIAVNNDNLQEITDFLSNLRERIIKPWVSESGRRLSATPADWRESWHTERVQIWGRIAKDKSDSHAVYWFHGNYLGNQSIKGTTLTGSLNRIGRIWHNMYPRYVIKNGKLTLTREYIELLIIFPDNSDISKDFIAFLENQDSEFTLIYPQG